MIRSLLHVGLQMPKPDLAKDFYSAFGLDVAEEKGRYVARAAQVARRTRSSSRKGRSAGSIT